MNKPTQGAVVQETKRLQASLQADKLVDINCLQAKNKIAAKELANRIRATLINYDNSLSELSHSHYCKSCNRVGGHKTVCSYPSDITRHHKCAENLARLNKRLNPDPRPLGCKCMARPCLHRPISGQEATRIIVVAGGLQIGQ